MIRQVHAMVAILALLPAFSAGCGSTKQHARFAQAGTVYASAVDRLLVAAGNTGIDANSERLLQDDALHNHTLKSHRELSSVDLKRLAIIGRLRAHARLPARYFALLNELATSDAPERAQQTVEDVVAHLNVLGKGLRGSEVVKNKDASKFATKLAVGWSVRGVLKKELHKRKDAIRAELATQQELLKVLTDAIQHDLTIIAQVREQRLVIGPLVAPGKVAKPEEWSPGSLARVGRPYRLRMVRQRPVSRVERATFRDSGRGGRGDSVKDGEVLK